jgi:hypothetical protein
MNGAMFVLKVISVVQLLPPAIESAADNGDWSAEATEAAHDDRSRTKLIILKQQPRKNMSKVILFCSHGLSVLA